MSGLFRTPCFQVLLQEALSQHNSMMTLHAINLFKLYFSFQAIKPKQSYSVNHPTRPKLSMFVFISNSFQKETTARFPSNSTWWHHLCSPIQTWKPRNIAFQHFISLTTQIVIQEGCLCSWDDNSNFWSDCRKHGGFQQFMLLLQVTRFSKRYSYRFPGWSPPRRGNWASITEHQCKLVSKEQALACLQREDG